MPSSVGKRERERQKHEKTQAKAERKAIRQATNTQSDDGSVVRSESEIVEELGAIHRALEAGELTPEDFEVRRDRLQVELGRIS